MVSAATTAALAAATVGPVAIVAAPVALLIATALSMDNSSNSGATNLTTRNNSKTAIKDVATTDSRADDSISHVDSDKSGRINQ